MRNDRVFIEDTGEWVIQRYRCVARRAYTAIQGTVYRHRREARL